MSDELAQLILPPLLLDELFNIRERQTWLLASHCGIVMSMHCDLV